MNKYERLVKPRLEEIKILRLAGATIQHIANALGVTDVTLRKYRMQYIELAQALKEVEFDLEKEIAKTAETGLMAKLKDKTIVEVTEDVSIVDGERCVNKRIEKERFIPADTTAIIFALKNRKPNEWNNQESELMNKRIEKLESDIASKQDSTDVGKLIAERLANYD